MLVLISIFLLCLLEITAKENIHESFTCENIYDPIALLRVPFEKRRKLCDLCRLTNVDLQTGEPSKKFPVTSWWWWSWQLGTTLVIGTGDGTHLKLSIYIVDLMDGETIQIPTVPRWQKTDFLFKIQGSLAFYIGEHNTIKLVVEEQLIDQTNELGWSFVRSFGSVSMINGEPCVIGGAKRRAPIVCYKTNDSKWVEDHKIIVRRHKHRSFFHNDTLYVCGGEGENGPTDTCLLINVKTGNLDATKHIPDFNNEKFAFFIMNDHVHVIGTSRSHSHVIKYDVDNGAKTHFSEYELVLGTAQPCYDTKRQVYSMLSTVEDELSKEAKTMESFIDYFNQITSLIVFAIILIILHIILHLQTKVDFVMIWQRLKNWITFRPNTTKSRSLVQSDNIENQLN